MSLWDDKSPVALPYFFDRSMQIRTSCILNIRLFRILHNFAAFLTHILMVVCFEGICREIVEVVFLFESIGRISRGREMIDLFDKLKRLAFLALMHNEYMNIINQLQMVIVFNLKLFDVFLSILQIILIISVLNNFPPFNTQNTKIAESFLSFSFH